MKLFIVEEIHSERLWLSEEESLHLTRVLRMKKSDTLYLTDGKGKLCETKVVRIANKKCEVEVIRIIQNNANRQNYYLHVAICPTKSNTRFEWFLEKATEIGIDEITILTGENSERKVFNVNRYKKIVFSSVKQSLNTFIPKINSAVNVKDFISKNSFSGQKIIAHCNTGFQRSSIKYVLKKGADALILIGPEGDFSPAEIETAYENSFNGVSLSDNRLRSETAAIIAVAHSAFINH